MPLNIKLYKQVLHKYLYNSTRSILAIKMQPGKEGEWPYTGTIVSALR